jgi:hypothetical protein
MEYLSDKNKEMLWGLLQESNVFTGIPSENFQKIKSIFDNTMYDISRRNDKNLMEKNKMTVEDLMGKMNLEKNTESNAVTKPKIQVVYKSEDLKEERNQQFNAKFEEQQTELNTLLNPKKPSSINFADSTDDEDKPIGNDMDRLIAERMATRERELDIPTLTEDGEKWLSNNNSNKIVKGVDLNEEEKRVSFKNNISEDITEVNTDTKAKPIPNITDLFKKIKRKPTSDIVPSITQPYKVTNIDNFSIKEEIEQLIKKQDVLIAENIEVKNRLNILLNKI